MSKLDRLQGTDFPDIRDGVAKLCEAFPDPYWRALDQERRYPTEFVQALGDAGYLAALIPEAYGGSGLPLAAAAAILEEVQRAGCNGSAGHAQMYIMGTLLRHGNEDKELQQTESGEHCRRHSIWRSPAAGRDTI